MKKRWKMIFLSVTAILIANAVLAADEDDRFHGGEYDGYDQNTVLDVIIPIPIPAGIIITIF